jgi:uncharacterized Zn finger protein
MRFSVDALRELAGDKVFARGQAYHREGRVRILGHGRERILAQVEGSDDYRIALTGAGGQIGGECSCPAFDDWGFCKHMVAAALAANAGELESPGEDGGAPAQIRRHLQAMGADALVELVMGLAERDPELFQKLDVAAAMASADDKSLEARLRKAIDRATRLHTYIDYRTARAWAAQVDAALDPLDDLVAAGRGAVAYRLAERAIERIEAAAQDVDDSDGHVGGLLERTREIHLAAARLARPEPLQLARQLFDREMTSDSDAFSGAAEAYAEVLGPEGLAEHRRLALEAWEHRPPRIGRPSGGENEWDRYRLTSILDGHARRDGDVEARIALRARDLSSPWKYLELAQFCLDQGRPQEALRRAEEGLWVFEDDRPDERLVRLAVDLLRKAGRKQDAAAHLWRAFEKAPSLELYLRIRTLEREKGAARARSIVETRLAGQSPGALLGPANLLVQMLMHEKAFDRAWECVRQYGASQAQKEALARASEGAHPQEAIATYAESVEHLATVGGNPAYEQAVALVARMARLRGRDEQAAYVAALKGRFARKRNLIKLLG